MQRRFATLDVFTSHRFTGNPLAVVRDAQGLSDHDMQAIAREFNLPETVFLLPPAEPGHAARLRIFTPANELPFAGHPTVGAAVLLGLGHEAQELVLGETIGPVRCKVEPLSATRGYAEFRAPTLPTRLGDTRDAALLAEALGLALDDLGCGAFEPGRWSAGIEFALVPVRGLDAIGRARCDLGRWDAAFGAVGPRSAYLFCTETVTEGHAFHARMFAPHMGIPEDPATGSALAALAGAIARHGGLADGTHALAVEQGYEMGRPSILHLSVTLAGGALTAVAIGGEAILVSEGRMEA
ncbi:MAG: PhzF family phenazine biosynthesis protein [Variibacter sp.]|nr:PhzF family phenazine biosynthesis protein [Variibacter sp.]